MKALILLRRLDILLPPLAVIAAVVAINAYALRFPHRLDMTTSGIYSIGPETKRVIASVDRPVHITFFYDIRSKALTDAKALLAQYAEASEFITARFFDPVLQPAEARRYNVRFAGTSVFESAARRITVNGGQEADFTNGLIRVTKQSTQRICFTDGHVESDPFSLKTHDHFEGGMKSKHRHSTGGRPLEIHERHGMGLAKDALETLGYKVNKVQLAKGPGQLDGCAMAIVASPQRPFEPREVEELGNYLAKGGRAILLLEPTVRANLAPLLAGFGVALEDGMVFDEARHYWTDPATPAVSEYPRHKITRNLAMTFFPGAASLIPAPGKPRDDVHIIRLIVSSRDARTGRAGQALGAAPKGSRTLMVEVIKNLGKGGEGDKPVRSSIIVVGDGDFATNSFFHILGNGALFLNAVNALAGEDKLIDLQPRNYVIPRMQLSNRQMMATFALSSLALPLVIFVIGGFVWWRRR